MMHLIGKSLAAIAIALLFVLPGTAQDNGAKKASNASKAGGQKADTKKTAAKKKGPARIAFEEKFVAWKSILQELRKLRTKYQTAETKDIPAIEKEWNELIKQGEAMLPGIQAAALAAYNESPNEDAALMRFLVKLMVDLIGRDQYEPALAIAQALEKNNAGYDEALRIAGVAAYSLNKFDLAEKYLDRAQQAGVLTGDAAKIRDEVATCKELWKKEVELREQEAKADDLPRVRLQTTKGDIVLELFENEAPETVGNFISLVEKKFYDGLTFHRVLPGFMAQAGCPVGDGTGGPGYNIYCECDKPEHRNHFGGSLSMAKSALKNTGGSQFFITFRPTPHLNGKHTVFGRVIEGMDVVLNLTRRDPDKSSDVQPDKIIKAEVIRKRSHEYKPHKV